MREQVRDDLGAQPQAWLSENALVAVWRGKVITVGYTCRLHGALKQIIRRPMRSR
jgi:hypothetical protein